MSNIIKPGEPATPQAPPDYRRHIIIDNLNKIIWVEVQCNLLGHPKQVEYLNIKNGEFWEYLPKVDVSQYKTAINNGFQVRPMLNIGGKDKTHYVIQIVDTVTRQAAIT